MKNFQIQLDDFKIKLKEISRSTTDIKKGATLAMEHCNTLHDRLHARIKAMQCFNDYLHNRYMALDSPDLY